MEVEKIAELPKCSPSLDKIMREGLGKGDKNRKEIIKIEKKQASPIGKRRPLAYYSPKPTIRRVIKPKILVKEISKYVEEKGYQK